MAQTRTGRGFAALPSSELRRISSAGGRASHRSGHAHEWTSQEARAAGARGGRAGHTGVADAEAEASPVPATTERLRGAAPRNDEVEPSRSRDGAELADDRVNASGRPEY